jgi:hypothetical protein
MTWLSATLSIASKLISILVLPIKLLFSGLLILLAPAIYLGSYAVAAALLPLKFFAKFEVSSCFFKPSHHANPKQTLYIYLGVAAIVGLVTGLILHFFSTMLVSLFSLAPVAPGSYTSRTAASVRAERQQRKLEAAWETSVPKKEPESWRDELSARRRQTEWLDADRGRKREEQGLLGQTILEEEDSEDDF